MIVKVIDDLTELRRRNVLRRRTTNAKNCAPQFVRHETISIAKKFRNLTLRLNVRNVENFAEYRLSLA